MNLETKSIKGFLAKNPVAICAFLGWNDAGETASNVVDHLIEVLTDREKRVRPGLLHTKPLQIVSATQAFRVSRVFREFSYLENSRY